jgi:hypothetical protein
MRLLFLTGQSGNSKKSPVDTFYFDIEQKKVRRSPRVYANVLSVVVNPGCFPGAKPFATQIPTAMWINISKVRNSVWIRPFPG